MGCVNSQMFSQELTVTGKQPVLLCHLSEITHMGDWKAHLLTGGMSHQYKTDHYSAECSIKLIPDIWSIMFEECQRLRPGCCLAIPLRNAMDAPLL